MSGRVRLWVFGAVGFVEGQAIEASPHGLRIKVSPVLPTALLRNGDRHPLEVVSGSGSTFNVTAEIRHVTNRRVGLRIDGPVPLDLFDGEQPRTNA